MNVMAVGQRPKTFTTIRESLTTANGLTRVHQGNRDEFWQCFGFHFVKFLFKKK